jgi:hypothetical protein
MKEKNENGIQIEKMSCSGDCTNYEEQSDY